VAPPEALSRGWAAGERGVAGRLRRGRGTGEEEGGRGTRQPVERATSRALTGPFELVQTRVDVSGERLSAGGLRWSDGTCTF
jgi:hypothetical protein